MSESRRRAVESTNRSKVIRTAVREYVARLERKRSIRCDSLTLMFKSKLTRVRELALDR